MNDQSSKNAPEIDANEKKMQHPLKGTVVRYEQPFEPATLLEDWEVLKDDLDLVVGQPKCSMQSRGCL